MISIVRGKKQISNYSSLGRIKGGKMGIKSEAHRQPIKPRGK